jgi:carnitine monooxygenase subunit
MAQAAVRLDAPPRQTLPSRCYTDPAIHAREMATIFRHAWQPFARTADLAAPGSYVAGSLLGEEIVVLRDRDGVLRGFFNVCQHRGHRLLKGKGSLKAAIACPYHAWSYGLDGRLRAAPNADNVPDFTKDGVALQPVAVEEFCNIVLVSLDPQATSFRAQHPGIEQEILSLAPRMGELAFHDRSEAALACNWKVAVENYGECYHCRTAHPTLTTGLLDPDRYFVELFERHHRHSVAATSNTDKLIYRIDPAAGPRAQELGSWLVWPNMAFQINPGSNYVLFHFEPTGPETTTARIDWFFGPWVAESERRRIVAEHASTTLAEDVSLVAEVQVGLRSRGYDRGVLMVDARHPTSGESEHPVAHLQDLWRRTMGLDTEHGVS